MSTPSPGASPSASPDHRLSPRWFYVAVAVAVVLVAVLALVLTGALSPTKGATVSLVSEQGATATAANVTSGVAGGPWRLTLAVGYLGGGPINVSRLIPQSRSCSVRNATTPVIPALAPDASYDRGLAQAWLLVYGNASGSTGLSVLVQNGGAAELGEWSGSDCRPNAPLATSLIDSTAAAGAVTATAIGANFVTDNPQANATYTLEYTSYVAGGVWKNATLWTMGFEAPPDESGPTFGAEVFANNGTVLCMAGFLPCSPTQ